MSSPHTTQLHAFAWDQVKAQANLYWHMSPRDILRALETLAKVGDS